MDVAMSTSTYIPVGTIFAGTIFNPTDFDLVNYYLKNKFVTDDVWKLDIYRFTPDQIREIRAPFRRVQEENMFIITPRHKLNGTGNIRPSRSTPGGGYWHMTGKLVQIMDASYKVIGTKTTLTWYQTQGVKSAWIMDEYTLKESDHGNTTVYPDSTMLDEVICKMHKTGRTCNDEMINHPQQRPSLKIDLSGIEKLINQAEEKEDNPSGLEKWMGELEDLLIEPEDTREIMESIDFDN